VKRGLWLAALSAVGGCNLVDLNTLGLKYAFDPQHFTQKFPDTGATVPKIPCDPTASIDRCRDAQSLVPASADATLACDVRTRECVATAELRLFYPVDLTKAETPLPSDAVQFGINAADLERVAYWVTANSLNTDTPPIDLYVAPQAAQDETQATRLGTVAMLPMGSSDCADPADPKGDPAAQGAMVCDLPLAADGKARLQEYVKQFKTTPFQIIAHAQVTARGDQPLPAGTIDFWVRPTVSIRILK